MQKYIDVVQDRYGRAIESASVYIYATGTFSTATLYSDEGVTAKANPLTTDANGEFSFYVADGEYDIRVVYGTTDVTKSDITIGDAAADSMAITGNATIGGTLGVTGLSTLASVDINGGAIDGTTVGATTPATGAFTTVSTTGAITLGNNLGPGITTANGYINIKPGVGATNHLYLDAPASASVYIRPNGSQQKLEVNGTEIVNSTGLYSSSAGVNCFLNAPTGHASALAVNGAGIISATALGASVTGTLSTTGNVTLGDATTDTVKIAGVASVGNATPAATGAGITFPATQSASSDANTLDDYETGTFTPTLTFATPGDLSVSYSEQRGRYTKIGRVVHVVFNITTSAFTFTTASGALRIGGLPFTQKSDSNLEYGALSWQGITKANYTNCVSQGASNQVYLTIGTSGSGQSSTTIVATDTPSGTTKVFYGSITYTV